MTSKAERVFHDVFANGGDGLPHHVVVQYYEKGIEFMCAAYFPDYDEANEFIEEMNDD